MRSALRRIGDGLPSDIPSLSLWLEADAGVILDGSGGVARWADRSGNGRDAIGTAGSRPTLGTLHGNRPGIAFNGSSQYLAVPHHADLRAASGLSVFCVVTSSASGVYKGCVGKWRTDATNDDWLLLVNSGGTDTVGAFGVSETGTGSSRFSSTVGDCSDGGRHVVEGYWSGSYVHGYRDGAEPTATACAGAKTGGVADVQIGRYSISTAGIPGWLAGTISAVLIYQRNLSALERATARRYLRGRWGTT